MCRCIVCIVLIFLNCLFVFWGFCLCVLLLWVCGCSCMGELDVLCGLRFGQVFCLRVLFRSGYIINASHEMSIFCVNLYFYLKHVL